MKYIGNIGSIQILLSIVCISWQPVLVVEEAGVPGEDHRPWTSNFITCGCESSVLFFVIYKAGRSMI